MEALKTMGAYLHSLKSFEIRAEIAYDDVSDGGNLIQRNESVAGAIRKPNRLWVKTSGAGREREIFYDGSTVTVFGARLGFYAQFNAPPTIGETVTAAIEKYDLEIPLSDLFFWGTDESDIDAINSAIKVGPAQIGNRRCDQYAFSQDDVTWQIWITQGETKSPCKLVIVDTSQDARPQYSATIEVIADKSFPEETFVFSAPKTAYKIKILASDAVD